MAVEALQASQRAEHSISTHERLCAERYDAIRNDVAEIKAALKWGLVILISALATICWSYLQRSLGL